MIHGGGFTMLSRKDVRAPQNQYLLDNGFLPVSVDYRLSPEVPVLQGGMKDVCDAMQWARESLPGLQLKIPSLRVSSKKLVVVGWSTGGTYAMTLPFTALQREVEPPSAVLAFYCPTDFEAESWYAPNYPEDSKDASQNSYDLLEGINEAPITEYNIPKDKLNVGGWMNLEDTRSRIVLHMNWKAQMPHVLLHGLPTKKQCQDQGKPESDFYCLPRPPLEEVRSISPASQIRLGNYTVPTFLVHGMCCLMFLLICSFARRALSSLRLLC
jgi:acetyl esterase/lipase